MKGHQIRRGIATGRERSRRGASARPETLLRMWHRACHRDIDVSQYARSVELQRR